MSEVPRSPEGQAAADLTPRHPALPGGQNASRGRFSFVLHGQGEKMPWGEQIHDEAEDHDGQDHEEEDTSPEGQDDKGNDDEHEGVEQSEDGEDDVVDEEKQKEKDAWAAKKAEDRCSRHTVRMNNKTRRARAQMARDFGN